MKRKETILMAALALAAAAMPEVAVAQQTLVAPMDSSVNLRSAGDYVPAQMAKDGKCLLTFTDFDKETGLMTATSIDGTLAPVADLRISSPADCYNSFMGGSGLMKMNWDTVERDTLSAPPSPMDYAMVEDFLANKGIKVHFEAKYVVDPTTSDGGVYMTEESYKEIDGRKVPWWFFVLTNSGYLIEVKCSGNCTLEYEYDNSPSVEYVSPLLSPGFYDYDNGLSSLGRVSLTQTLLNDDDAFEYFSPVCVEPEVSGGVWPYTGYLYDIDGTFAYEFSSENFSSISGARGFRIMREDGTELQSVLFGENLTSSGFDFMTIIFFGGERYLSCAVGGKTILYRLNSAVGTVEKVASFNNRVYPTLVEPDGMVNVEFGEAGKVTGVGVWNVAGTKGYNSKVAPDQRSMSIPASRLSKGLNIVTLSGNDGQQSSTKVIVK